MSSRALFSTVLFVSMAIAGCSGPGDVPDAAAGMSASAAGSQFEGSGSIRGSVTDETYFPIEGAQVALPLLNLQTLTDAEGAFLFQSLAAGTYQVYVAKLGFESVGVRVTVEDGQQASLSIAMVPLAVEAVYHETSGLYGGFVTCAFVTPGVSGYTGSITWNCNNGVFESLMGDQHNTLEFELAQENIHAVIGEMQWTPATTATSQQFALFFTHEDGYGSDWWCNAAGGSPVQFVYHVEEDLRVCTGQGSGTDGPPETDMTLHLTAFLPFSTIYPTNPTASTLPNVAFQQHYESLATVFYGEDPVLPFRAFPDA